MSLRLADSPLSKITEPLSAVRLAKEHLGTCLWIGNHRSRWTADLMTQCVDTYAQVAVRGSVTEAIERPCQAVTRILVVRVDSQDIEQHAVESLAQRHPSARLMEIRGPLCESFYRFANPVYHDGHRHWNVAGAILGIAASTNRPRSVMVVAPDFDTAAPLIAAAKTAGISAVWTRQPHPETITGTDEIWWHDAGMTSETYRQNKARMSQLSQTRPLRHVLIATGPIDHAWNSMFDRIVVQPGHLRDLVGKPDAALNNADLPNTSDRPSSPQEWAA